MKTATLIPAQAAHQLPQVAHRFDHWRQTRPSPAEPIPHSLWEHAIALTATVPITRVATSLRVSGGELQKRCAAHHAVRSVPVSTPLGFVAVPATPVRPTPTMGTAIALQRPDGPRLRSHTHEPPLPVAPLVRTFLETPACSS